MPSMPFITGAEYVRRFPDSTEAAIIVEAAAEDGVHVTKNTVYNTRYLDRRRNHLKTGKRIPSMEIKEEKILLFGEAVNFCKNNPSDCTSSSKFTVNLENKLNAESIRIPSGWWTWAMYCATGEVPTTGRIEIPDVLKALQRSPNLSAKELQDLTGIKSEETVKNAKLVLEWSRQMKIPLPFEGDEEEEELDNSSASVYSFLTVFSKKTENQAEHYRHYVEWAKQQGITPIPSPDFQKEVRAKGAELLRSGVFSMSLFNLIQR